MENMRKILYILCYDIAVEKDVDSDTGGWMYKIEENGESKSSIYSPLAFLHALKHLEECRECREVNIS
ncbi:MAG: hypothetical protein QW718_01125 [Nitrososphaerota archaeon]